MGNRDYMARAKANRNMFKSNFKTAAEVRKEEKEQEERIARRRETAAEAYRNRKVQSSPVFTPAQTNTAPAKYEKTASSAERYAAERGNRWSSDVYNNKGMMPTTATSKDVGATSSPSRQRIAKDAEDTEMLDRIIEAKENKDTSVENAYLVDKYKKSKGYTANNPRAKEYEAEYKKNEAEIKRLETAIKNPAPRSPLDRSNSMSEAPTDALMDDKQNGTLDDKEKMAERRDKLISRNKEIEKELNADWGEEQLNKDIEARRKDYNIKKKQEFWDQWGAEYYALPDEDREAFETVAKNEGHSAYDKAKDWISGNKETKDAKNYLSGKYTDEQMKAFSQFAKDKVDYETNEAQEKAYNEAMAKIARMSDEDKETLASLGGRAGESTTEALRKSGIQYLADKYGLDADETEALAILQKWEQNKIDTEEYNKAIKPFLKKHPWLAWAATSANNLAGVFYMTGQLRDASDAQRLKELGYEGKIQSQAENNPLSAAYNLNTLNQEVNGDRTGGWYNRTNQIANNLLMNATGRVASALMFFSSGYAGGVNEATANGADFEHAQLTGAAQGSNEMIWEKLSWGSLGVVDRYTGGAIKSAGIGRALMEWLPKVALDMGINGLEEVNTDIANDIADYLINGDFSRYALEARSLLEEGYGQDEVNSIIGKEIAKSYAETFKEGALQGGLMAGGYRAISEYNARRMGKQAQKYGYTNQILQNAEGVGESAKEYKDTVVRQEGGEQNLSPAQIGRVVQETQKTLAESEAARENLKEYQVKNKTQILDDAIKKTGGIADENVKKALYAGYDGGDALNYVRRFKAISQFASSGIITNEDEFIDYVTEQGIAEGLTPQAIYAAYSSGINSKVSEKGAHVFASLYDKTKAERRAINMQVAIADKIGKKYGGEDGLSFVFVRTGEKKNGRYRLGTNQIVIDLDAEGGLILRTAGHEVYHWLEAYDEEHGTTYAKDIANELLEYYKGNKGEKWVEDTLTDYYEAYEENKRVSEFAADNMFDAFYNERAMKELAADNPEFFGKLKQHVQELIDFVKKSIEELKKVTFNGKLQHEEIITLQDNLDELNKVNNMFLDALNAANKKTSSDASGVVNSIKRDTNGEIYVEVEGNILNGTGKSYAQVVSDIIKTKFNSFVEVNGQGVKMNTRTSGKWVYSKYSQSLLKKDIVKFEDKMRSINNIDEILKTAKDWINEKSKHNNYPQFARGLINFKVGNNGYSADVVVGISKDGSATLYDMVNIMDKVITEAPIAPVGKNASRRNGTSVQVNNNTPSSQSQGGDANSFKRDYKYLSQFSASTLENKPGIAPQRVFSLKRNGELIDNAVKYNNEHGAKVNPITLQQTKGAMKMLANYLKENFDKLGLPADVEGNTAIGNASYGGVSEESTTLCPRSLALTEFADAVSDIVGRPLTVKESLVMAEEASAWYNKNECIYCYVAMDRKAKEEFVGKYIKERNAIIKEVKNGMDRKEAYKKYLNGRKDTKPMQARWALWMNILDNGGEFISAKQLASHGAQSQSMNSDNKSIADQAKDAMKYAQSASWAKKVINYLAYNGHILKWSDDKIRKLNSQYGLRMYSFSDYSPAYILENMQMVMDASVRGLKMLAYTKEADFVKIFAGTGMNINVSTFAHYDAKTDTIIEDNMYGVKWSEAQELRKQYNNVGVVFVATNDKLVEWGLAQDWIDVVIPFHLVRTGQTVAQHFNFKDFTSESADVKTKEWKKGDKKTIYPPQHNNDKETFLRLCEENHLTPRFERWVDNPNYMKLVNETRRSANETPAVQPSFDSDATEAAYDSLNQMIREGGYMQHVGVTIDNMHELAHKVAETVKSKSTENESEYRLSTQRGVEYAPTFYSQMGKVVDDIKQDKLSVNGLVNMLKGKGVKDEEIQWSGIEEWLADKGKSVTKEELQEFIKNSMLNIERVTLKDEEDTEMRVVKVSDTQFYAVSPEGEKAYFFYDEDSEMYFSPDTALEFESPEEAESYFNDPYMGIEEHHITKWHDYKTKGGSNYREILFTIPNSNYTNQAMGVHWNMTGVLAHARIQDMPDSNGSKMLFIDEIQSDWHNAAEKKENGSPVGYVKKGERTRSKVTEELQSNYADFKNDETIKPLAERVANIYYATDVNMDRAYMWLMTASNREISQLKNDGVSISESESKAIKFYSEKQKELLKEQDTVLDRAAPPDAPFKNGKYVDYVLKNMLRMAAENGYDKLAWTPSEMQSERWSDKFAEGYRIEYDQDIPKFLNKFGKKFGAKVGISYINPADNRDSQYLKDKISSLEELIEISENEWGADNATAQSYKTQLEILKKQLQGTPVWSIDITPEMRDSVLYEGQALYSTKRDQEYFDAIEKYGEDSKEVAKMTERAAFEWGAFSDYKAETPIDFYHGTPNGGFTVFGGTKTRNGADAAGSYWFTENDREHAGVYRSYPGGAKTAENPMTYKVWIKAGNYADIGNGRVMALDYERDGAGAATKELKAVAKAIAFKTMYNYQVKSGKWLGMDEIEKVERRRANQITKQLTDIARNISADFIWQVTETKEFAELCQSEGLDGVIAWEQDKGYNGTEPRMVKTYGVFNRNDIKSADPVTYDDQGNVIPLSERFNKEEPDIRYSSKRDSEGNNLTESQEKYFSGSKVRDEDGNLLVVYHGTNEKFTVFDRAKGRANMDIQGMFFSPWEIDAGGYGQNVGKYYLNITNPAPEDVAYKVLNTYKGQNKAGVKAREYLEKLGYDGVNNGNEEYIAFNSNQIKRVDNLNPTENEDTRYSERRDIKYEAEQTLENASEAEMKQIVDAVDRELLGDAMGYGRLLGEQKRKTEQKVKEQRRKDVEYYHQRMREIRADRDQKLMALKMLQYQKEVERKEFSKRQDYKGRIIRKYEKLQKMLLHPTENQHVPADLVHSIADFLEYITPNFLQEQYRKDGTTIKKREKNNNRLMDLVYAYGKIKEEYEDVYDEEVYNLLQEASKSFGKKTIDEMDSYELSDINNLLGAIEHTIRRANKAIVEGKERDAFALARNLVRQSDEGKKKQSNFFKRLLWAQLNPYSIFHAMSNYEDGGWMDMYKILNEGQLRKTQIQVDVVEAFRELMDNKELDKLSDYKNGLVDIGLIGDNNQPVKITRGFMLALYLNLQNEQNRNHIAEGGLTIPDFEKYYKGDMEAWGNEIVRTLAINGDLFRLHMEQNRLRELKRASNSKEIKARYDDDIAELENQMNELRADADRFMDDIMVRIESQLTDYERKFIDKARWFFNEYSKDKLNEATMQMYGFKKAREDNYMPIITDSDFLNAQFESVVRDASLENMGFMKERVKGANNAIKLFDLTDVINAQLNKVSKYAGLAPAIKEFNNVYNKKFFTDGRKTSVQESSKRRFGVYGQNYIEYLLADLQGARKAKGSTKIFSQLRGNSYQAALLLNIRVSMAQAASYPTAAAEVGWKPLQKALLKGGKDGKVISKADRELIDVYTPLLANRFTGGSSTDITNVKNTNLHTLSGINNRVLQRTRAVTDWIQMVDTATVGRLWSAAEYYVDEHYNLDKGTEEDIKNGQSEYYKKVAEVFNRIVERTQPSYTTMQRPELLRNPNEMLRMFTMFMTQRAQNFNLVYDSVGKFLHENEKKKSGVYDVSEYADAKSTMGRVVASQAIAGVTLATMKALADAIQHNFKDYKDDDDDITILSVLERIFKTFLESEVSNMAGGSELFSFVESAVTGSTYYGITANVAGSIEDMSTAVGNLFKYGVNAKTLTRVATTSGMIIGIPASQMKKWVEMFVKWGTDIANGEFDSE